MMLRHGRPLGCQGNERAIRPGNLKGAKVLKAVLKGPS